MKRNKRKEKKRLEKSVSEKKRQEKHVFNGKYIRDEIRHGQDICMIVRSYEHR